ncbi:hypothetical protein [Fibrella aquatilis]|uniref:Uncharacterized protein n=1 Tax=Fibrella aquatilis TaxID=2817059 RepID=A0A939JZM6_9BACT|nr:hypothetical protein [Fibrella aquatilis]MBO0933309.1 hypothetical protein [Fibrella aquatilis]
MLLAMPQMPGAQRCLVDVQTTSILGNLAYDNVRKSEFIKTPLKQTPTGWQFRVELVQFNQEETGGLARLDSDTLQLRNNMLVETDHTGQLIRILNKEELRLKWAALRPSLLHKYSHDEQITPVMIEAIGYVLNGDGYLEETLNRGYEYSLLFPPLYTKNYTEKPIASRPRIIARFLGDLNLTFTTTATQRTDLPPDAAYGVFMEGAVDKATYPTEAVRQGLRNITDEPLLDTTLNAQHMESYEFDASSNLLYGAQSTMYGVSGVFFTRNVATIQASLL